MHSPIPISSYSTLLPQLGLELPERSFALRQTKSDSHLPEDSTIIYPSTPTGSHSRSRASLDHVEHFPTYSAASQTFLPPSCEILDTVAGQDFLDTQTHYNMPRQKSRAVPYCHIGGTGVDSSSKKGKVRSSTSNTYLKSSNIVREPQRLASMPVVAGVQEKARPENIRKVFFRTVQNSVGFKHTDP